jgi:hypothetical protein
MSGLIIKSTNTYSEVISGTKVLLHKHNSSTGLNISCFDKLLSKALNWNITSQRKLVDLMKKIPKGFISTITINGDVNSHLTPNDITFLKDNLNTRFFDDISNIPKHWCVVFYKSESSIYNVLSEKFGNEDIILEIKTTELLEKTKAKNIIHQTPLDILKNRVNTLEEKNTELEKMLNEQKVKNEEKNANIQKTLDEQIIDTTKKIEESHDIYNKFMDSIEKQIIILTKSIENKINS